MALLGFRNSEMPEGRREKGGDGRGGEGGNVVDKLILVGYIYRMCSSVHCTGSWELRAKLSTC